MPKVHDHDESDDPFEFLNLSPKDISHEQRDENHKTNVTLPHIANRFQFGRSEVKHQSKRGEEVSDGLALDSLRDNIQHEHSAPLPSTTKKIDEIEQAEIDRVQGGSSSDILTNERLDLQDARKEEDGYQEQYVPSTSAPSTTLHSIQKITYDDNGQTRAILSKEESNTEEIHSHSSAQILSSQKPSLASRACVIPDEKWQQVREAVVSLYMTQGLPLHSVRDHLQKSMGFEATLKQYKTRFAQWGLRKYMPKIKIMPNISLGHNNNPKDAFDTVPPEYIDTRSWESIPKATSSAVDQSYGQPADHVPCEDQKVNENPGPTPGTFESVFSGAEGSSGSTDFSTVESEGELSFICGTDASPAIPHVDQALFNATCRTLALRILQRFSGSLLRSTPSASNPSKKGADTSGLGTATDSGFATSKAALSSGKRPSSMRESSNDMEDEDDGDSRRNPKRNCRTTSKNVSSRRLLACPYSKMDPIRYSERNLQEQCYRGCAIRLLRNIPRLKQHLYRAHLRPKYYCSRCYAIFEMQALVDIHSRQNPSCVVLEPQFEEKMDNDQMNAIKRRNRRMDATAEWYNIFKILFPNAVLPASPYADRGTNEIVQNFMSYFQEEAPSILSDLVRSALNGRVFLDEQSQEILDEAFEQAVSQLVLRFEARHEHVDSLPETGEQAIGGHATSSTTSLNRLTPRSDAGDAAQGMLEDGNITDPNDLFFDIASESWLDPNFFD